MENPSDDSEARSSPQRLILCLIIFAVLALGSFIFFPRSQSVIPKTTALPELPNGPAPASGGIDPAPAVPADAPPTIIRTIELTNFYSCALTNAINMGRLKVHPNNLGEFPVGEAEYGGMLFAVRGMIQLGGAYPRQRRGISIGARARALHILHGTAGLTDDGTEIARLVIHYQGGEDQQVAINYGDHVRDWWKWKKTENPNVGADSELAWTGSNPFAKAKNVELRIFRSTFANPFPDKLVETIDYIRNPGTSCTPFMLGLTIQEESGDVPAKDLPAIPK